MATAINIVQRSVNTTNETKHTVKAVNTEKHLVNIANTANASNTVTPQTAPEHYVHVPQRLLATAVYAPLQVGIYILVARLFGMTQHPVPLSATDVALYDPSISRSAAQRALSWLVKNSWLLAHEQKGCKTTYEPSWGKVRGVVVPWQVDAPCWGRPRHVRTVKITTRLLDTFLGKLTLHPKRAAVPSRYVTMPLLGLADVGSYALLLNGLPGTTQRLKDWNLVRDEQALPVPEDTTILAQVSQASLFNNSVSVPTLTARGFKKAGFPQPPPVAAGGQPLFFVPSEMLGDLPKQVPAYLLDSKNSQEEASTALQSQKEDVRACTPEITWRSHESSRNHMDSVPMERTNTTDTTGGGHHAVAVNYTPRKITPKRTVEKERRKTKQRTVPVPNTPTARTLANINVLPEQVIELADMPLAVVNDAIRDGQSRPDVRNLAGWVVTVLRNHRDHGCSVTASPQAAYAPEALGAYFAQKVAEQASERARKQEALDRNLVEAEAVETQRVDPLCIDMQESGSPSSQEELWAQAQEMVQLRLPRSIWWPWLSHTRLIDCQGGTAIVSVPSTAAKHSLEEHALYVLREVLHELISEVLIVRVVLAGVVQPRTQPPGPLCSQVQ